MLPIEIAAKLSTPKKTMTTPFHAELAAFITANPQYQEREPDPDVEKELAQLLTEEDLIALNLPTHLLPRILNPLPRHYLQIDPRISRLKDPFRSLPELKKHIIDKALVHLYLGVDTPPQKTLVLFSWVVSDGFGDYFSQQEAATLLKKAFPELAIELVTLLHHSKPLPKNTTAHIVRYTHSMDQKIITEAFSPDLCSLLASADLILEFPTRYSELPSYAAKENILSIGEHCGYRFVPFHPSTGARSMGLHFMEKGIFCKQLPPPDPQALPLLSGHTLHCAYTKTARGTYLYLLTLLHALKHTDQPCAIYFIHMPHLIDVLEPRLRNSQSLALCNVKEIHLISQKGNNTTLQCSSTGKVVRVIDTGILEQPQVTSLFSLSQTLIGCTGDQSVLEAISTGTPFFYDPPPFKRPFLNDLKALAAARVSLKLAQFFELCLKRPEGVIEEPCQGWVSEELFNENHDAEEQIAIALGDGLEALKEDFATLRTILREEYDFEPFLIGLVKRALHHQSYPQVAEYEQQQVNAFIHGEQTAKETLAAISDCLKKHK